MLTPYSTPLGGGSSLRRGQGLLVRTVMCYMALSALILAQLP